MHTRTQHIYARESGTHQLPVSTPFHSLFHAPFPIQRPVYWHRYPPSSSYGTPTRCGLGFSRTFPLSAAAAAGGGMLAATAWAGKATQRASEQHVRGRSTPQGAGGQGRAGAPSWSPRRSPPISAPSGPAGPSRWRRAHCRTPARAAVSCLPLPQRSEWRSCVLTQPQQRTIAVAGLMAAWTLVDCCVFRFYCPPCTW